MEKLMLNVAERFRLQDLHIQQIQEGMKQWTKWQEEWQTQMERVDKTVETQGNYFTWGQQYQQQQWDVMQQHMKNWTSKHQK